MSFSVPDYYRYFLNATFTSKDITISLALKKPTAYKESIEAPFPYQEST